ncbi:hypothetical protein RPALISO_177 [Ruegeria phage RpAliso]|nr:hypothetical protein RPALISO_177 [Ruegeria phage RpAliso]
MSIERVFDETMKEAEEMEAQSKSLVARYRKAKGDYDSAREKMRLACHRVLNHYRPFKRAVSTRELFWRDCRIASWAITSGRVTLTLQSSGQYGHTPTAYFRFPVRWLEIPDHKLDAAIRERIAEEGQKITRQQDATAKGREARERAELAALKEKYPDE